MSGRWLEETVGGHPCDIYEPSTVNPYNYVVLYLHGVHLNRLVDKTAFTDQFEKHGLPVVAPMTQRSWWTDKICSEFDANITAQQHVMENVLPFIQERFDSQPGRIALLGTSMGGQGALRFSYKFPNKFPIVAAISPAVDYQVRFEDGDETIMEMYPEPEAVRQDTATLHIHPLNWPRNQFFCVCRSDYRWWDSVDRLRMKLYSLGIPHECEMEDEGGGHGFQYYDTMAERAMDFIVNSLDKERRRII